MALYQKLLEKIEAQGPYKIYQAWPRLGIEGQRPTDERFEIYGLASRLTPEMTVLDLGSNVGFMALKCAEFAAQVHGVERYAHWVEIAQLAKQCLHVQNCVFHLGDALNLPPMEFDIILSLSFHHWRPEIFERYSRIVYTGMLKPGGWLLFESHGPKSRDLFEQHVDYLVSVGFAVRQEGECQCATNYPRPNPHRKFYWLELINK